MKIKESSRCNFCPNEDDILHFFIFCPAVYQFWKDLMLWVEQKLHRTFTFPLFPTPSDIVFGIPGEDNFTLMLNFLILHAKNYIHFRRLFKDNILCMTEFLNIIKYKIRIELVISETNNKMSEFDKFRTIYPHL